ncbi:MAG: tRNA pseudouridine synthase A [Bacteroidales bacterium]|nr:tRNA pseudouridine synthase A [Bacteroidales bacterium]
MRYSITLSYSGAGFCGWQKQPSAPSVQECLEDALGKLLGTAVEVIGAGRTDTGVNAIGYVACFDGPEGLAAEDFRYKLNAILPRSVVVSQVAPAADGFHARFDARRREYTYFLHRVKDPFIDAYSLLCGYPELDFEAMNRAAALLVGTHDFSCFEKVGADNKTSVCTVFEAEWRTYVPSHVEICGGPGQPSAAGKGPVCVPQGDPSTGIARPYDALALPGAAPYWYFRISADRFLRNMVRAIVGTLIEVGRGKRSIDDFTGLVLPAENGNPSAKSKGSGRVPQGEPGPGIAFPKANAARRSLAGESVPGHALFLSKVEY